MNDCGDPLRHWSDDGYGSFRSLVLECARLEDVIHSLLDGFVGAVLAIAEGA